MGEADNRPNILFSVALILSGFAGISYEILYARILGNLLGDQFAVSAAVLITFLLGIGLGSKFAHRLWKHLWLIEAFIGLYGVGVAFSQERIDQLLYQGLGALPGLPGAILLGCLLLLLPAFLIGCSVPLFAGYLQRLEQGAAFPKVYAVYNYGAAATALLIEFFFIRTFGITNSLLAFTAVNFTVAAMLYLFYRNVSHSPAPVEEPMPPLPLNQSASLVLVCISSAVFQLFMVKMAEMMFGPLRETFALVLAIILFGIATGSYLVKRLNIGYPALLLANIAGLLVFMAGQEYLIALYAMLYEWGVEHGAAIIFLKGAILLFLMAVPSLTFGATIPALLRSGGAIARGSGALLYVASLANVAGFLLMALVLHRLLDYGVQLLVMSGLVVAALLLFAGWRSRAAVAAIAGLLVTGAVHRWHWDEDLLYLSYTNFHSLDDMRETREKAKFPDRFKGFQDVFSINWIDGVPYFFINGYISIPLNNPSEKVVGTAGSLFAPRTQEALVLGLGSGGTASSVGMLFDHTDVVEINPVVRENLYRMKRWNFDMEHNPNVHIVVDDAIHYAKSSDKQYDMILNTVTSPLYFSSAKLYTRDFFGIIKQRLKPDGIYIAWMDSRIGGRGADIIIKTLREKFGHCSILFIKASYYLLIASDQPVQLRHPDLADRAQELKLNLMGVHDRIPRHLAYNLLTTRAYDLVEKSDAPINTVDRPELEFEIARIRKKGFNKFRDKLLRSLDMEEIEAAVEPAMPYDPAMHVAHVASYLKSSVITERWEQLGEIYVSRYSERLEAAKLERYRMIADTVQDAPAHHKLGFQLMKRKRHREALAEFEKALAIDPRRPVTLFNMASCYEHERQYSRAITYYEKAAVEDPQDPDAPFRLGRVYAKMHQWELSLKQLQRSLEMKKDADTLLLKGEALERLKRPEEAEKAYLKALKMRPGDQEILKGLNRLLAKW